MKKKPSLCAPRMTTLQNSSFDANITLICAVPRGHGGGSAVRVIGSSSSSDGTAKLFLPHSGQPLRRVRLPHNSRPKWVPSTIWRWLPGPLHGSRVPTCPTRTSAEFFTSFASNSLLVVNSVGHSSWQAHWQALLGAALVWGQALGPSRLRQSVARMRLILRRVRFLFTAGLCDSSWVVDDTILQLYCRPEGGEKLPVAQSGPESSYLCPVFFVPLPSALPPLFSAISGCSVLLHHFSTRSSGYTLRPQHLMQYWIHDDDILLIRTPGPESSYLCPVFFVPLPSALPPLFSAISGCSVLLHHFSTRSSGYTLRPQHLMQYWIHDDDILLIRTPV
ncbi:hypothetical protein BC827DRAFT_1221815 [Russula dissimulans]|nr:hypothetical protein BC827DRAFT_1221815 [Russula dissimulans]